MPDKELDQPQKQVVDQKNVYSYKRKNSKWVVAFLLLLLLGAGGYWWFSVPEEDTGEVTEIREEIVEVGNILIGFSGDGQAEIPVVNLDFEVGGILRELYVEEQEVLEPDQILARLDDTDYQTQVTQAEISYQRALLSLEQKKESHRLSLLSEEQTLEELTLSLAQLDAEYTAMLSLQEYHSQQELDAKKKAVASTRLSLETQQVRYETALQSTLELQMEENAVKSARLNLEIAQNNLEKTVLTAPLSATVLNISYKLGETVSSVRETGQTTADTGHFMVVTDSDQVEVVVPVSEIDLNKVYLGQIVEVVYEAYDTDLFTGTVTSISSLPLIDQSGLVTYDVRIKLDSGIDKIRSGMTCIVDFVMRQEKDVLVIMNRAVTIENGVQIVNVKSEDGTIEKREITTGLTDGRYVAVTSGLSAGEIVLVQ